MRASRLVPITLQMLSAEKITVEVFDDASIGQLFARLVAAKLDKDTLSRYEIGGLLFLLGANDPMMASWEMAHPYTKFMATAAVQPQLQEGRSLVFQLVISNHAAASESGCHDFQNCFAAFPDRV